MRHVVHPRTANCCLSRQRRCCWLLVPVRNRPGSVVRSQRRCEICAPRSFDNVALPPRSSSGLALPMPAPTFSGPPLGVSCGLRLSTPSSPRAATGARAIHSQVHPPCYSLTFPMLQRGQGPLASSPTPATGSPLPLPATPASALRSRPLCSGTSMILPFHLASTSRLSLFLRLFLLPSLLQGRRPPVAFLLSRAKGLVGVVFLSNAVSSAAIFFFFPSSCFLLPR